MSKNKQSSDHAQKGPGFKAPSGFKENTAPSIGSAGNSKSGSSQSHSRGKQG